MTWQTPYVVFRLGPDARLVEVFRADDIKKARYWLTYIAQSGDVLCKTCLHSKHSKSSSAPEYCSHKEESGKASSDESDWRNSMSKKGWNSVFPESQGEIAPSP